MCLGHVYTHSLFCFSDNTAESQQGPADTGRNQEPGTNTVEALTDEPEDLGGYTEDTRK